MENGFTYFCEQMRGFESYTKEALRECWDTMHQQERDEWTDSAANDRDFMDWQAQGA